MLILPLHLKKNERLHKSNYRPISILPTLSKVYEKLFYIQIYKYFNNIFSKYLCGFRQGQSTQHCLLFMLEYLKKALDKGLCTGVLLTDLSKAFDCICHDLLIAKLHAYGFSKKSLNLVNNYLCNRTQRTKVGESFSSWRNIFYGVPQGSILGPLLFNIYINDVFLFSKHFNMANYADDCSPYEFSDSIDEVILKLQNDSKSLIEWYESNYLKPNPDKWHLLLSDKRDDIFIKIGTEIISNSTDEKILGVYFDNKLYFNTHLKKLCKKSYLKGINFRGYKLSRDKLLREQTFAVFLKFAKVCSREMLSKQPSAKVCSREMLPNQPSAKVCSREMLPKPPFAKVYS